jgi:hypothetical protein
MAVILLEACPLLSQEPGRSPGPSDDAWHFLTNRLPLTAADRRELNRGRPAARTLDTVHDREVATIGIVSMDVPASFYVEQLRRIASFKNASKAVLEIGTFSTPAVIDDLAGLSFTQSELSRLRRCRLHACGIQLSSEAIERIREPRNASGDQRTVAEREFRQILVDLVNRYREHGDTALMTYADAEPSVSVAAAFRQIVDSRPAILRRLPALFHHVSSFPRNTPGVSDVIYWSKEDFGPAVIVTVTHLVIAPLTPSGNAFAAASKQIYSSHYFDSSLGITVVVDEGADRKPPRSFLAYANRSRIDALGGLWGPLKGAVVRARTRSSVRDNLAAARMLVERRFETLASGTARQGPRAQSRDRD